MLIINGYLGNLISRFDGVLMRLLGENIGK